MIGVLLLACSSAPAPSSTPPEPTPAASGTAPKLAPAAPAPARSWMGLTLGTSDAAAIEAWVQPLGASCVTAPALRRQTVRTECKGELPLTLLPDRVIRGQLSQLTLARTDAGPLHYLGAARRYSLPPDAGADYTDAVADLTAIFGKPGRSAPVDPAKLDSPVQHLSSRWTFADLEVSVTLMRMGTPYLTVTETWRTPGVEEAVAVREGSSFHGDRTPAAPGSNPHATETISAPPPPP